MHALHDTARDDAQAAPTQLCSTTAAADIRGTGPLPAPSGVVVPPSSTCMLCMACRTPVPKVHREAGLHPALLPDLGSLHNTLAM
jgi:hypothetical protein